MKTALTFFLFILLLASCRSAKPTTQTADKTSSMSKGQKDSVIKAHGQGFLIEGNVKRMNGDLDGAIKAYLDCLTFDAKNDAAWYELSRIYEAKGNFAKALEAAELAAELDEKNEWYMFHLALQYQRSGLVDKCSKAYDRLIGIQPKKAEYYIRYSEFLNHNNQFEKAIDVLEKGEKATGADDQVIYQKFRLYAENEKYNEALVELEKLIKSNPYDPTFLGIAAEVYESMGQKDKAKALYDRILKMDPNNGIVHLSLAQLYWFDGDKTKAQEELKMAMSSGNLDIDSKIKIILDLFVQPGNTAVDPKVYELLNLLETAHPKEGRVFSLYGDLLFREKKYKESREKFAKAVELDKSSFITWSNLISLDSEIKDWNAMYSHAKEASELFPSQASFYYFCAYAAYQKGNYKECVETALMGKELVFENPPLQYQFWELLGNAYHQLNLHTESDAAYDEALRIDPNNAFLLNNYAYYLSLRKTQLAKAAEMSKKSNALIINQASFEDTYAWILFLQKDYVNAELWLKKALEHGGSESGVILEHYGDVLFFLNKKEEALNYWKKAKSKGGTGDKIDLKISDGKYHE